MLVHAADAAHRSLSEPGSSNTEWLGIEVHHIYVTRTARQENTASTSWAALIFTSTIDREHACTIMSGLVPSW